MIKKYEIDMLSEKSVSVKTQKFTEIEGGMVEVGKPHRKAYVNSVRGRNGVVNELPQTQQNAIFSVWGDTPTVDETVTD